MVRIVKISKTCDAFPAQWEGLTDGDRQVYIRYRCGYLSVRLGEAGDMTMLGGVRGEEIYAERLSSDELHGYMEYDELKRVLDGIVSLPETDNTRAS